MTLIEGQNNVLEKYDYQIMVLMYEYALGKTNLDYIKLSVYHRFDVYFLIK
jgi:hypothetical protein